MRGSLAFGIVGCIFGCNSAAGLSDLTFEGTAPGGGGTAGAGGGSGGMAGQGGSTEFSHGDVLLVYGEAAGPVERIWSDEDATWSAPSPVVELAAPIRWIDIEAPGNQHLVAVSTDNSIVAQLHMLLRVAGGWSEVWTEALGGANGEIRSFDMVALGDGAMVVYADGSSVPQMRLLEGGTWTDPAPASAGAASNVRWVVLDARPGFPDEAVLAFSDDGFGLFAVKWSRSGGWGSVSDLGAGSINQHGQRCFDVAYEQESGDVLAAWGVGTVEETRAAESFAGDDGFQPPQPVATGTLADSGVVELVPQLGSDRIALVQLECSSLPCGSNNNNFEGAIWTGVDFVNTEQLDADLAHAFGRVGTMPLGGAWLEASGAFVGVYPTENSVIDYAAWTNAWQLFTFDPQPAVTARVSITVLPTKAGQDELMMILSDDTGALHAKRSEAGVWTDTEGGAPLSTGLSSPEIGRPFAINAQREAAQ